MKQTKQQRIEELEIKNELLQSNLTFYKKHLERMINGWQNTLNDYKHYLKIGRILIWLFGTLAIIGILI